MTFFWMKLSSENIIARDGRRKGSSVVGGRNRCEWVGGLTEITMYEVKAFMITNILPQRMTPCLQDTVPPHVWDFLR